VSLAWALRVVWFGEGGGEPLRWSSIGGGLLRHKRASLARRTRASGTSEPGLHPIKDPLQEDFDRLKIKICL